MAEDGRVVGVAEPEYVAATGRVHPHALDNGNLCYATAKFRLAARILHPNRCFSMAGGNPIRK